MPFAQLEQGRANAQTCICVFLFPARRVSTPFWCQPKTGGVNRLARNMNKGT